jgi:hypothetical protein
MDIGVTSFATLGLEILIPDTALTTDTAGVKIPSAIVKLVPKRHFQCPSVGINSQARKHVYPNEQGPPEDRPEMTIGRGSECGESTFLKAVTSESAVRVEVLVVRGEKALKKSERSSFTF